MSRSSAQVTQACCRIGTQKGMRVARSNIDFCYICGRPLPPRGPGFKKQTIGEHVVPRNLLGEAPPKNAWAVELDVHRRCEQTTKSIDDTLLSLLQKISTTDASEWPDAGYVRQLDFEMVALTSTDNSYAVPAFGNADRVLKGAWTWIRGLHAALYQAHLSANRYHREHPPVPAFGTADEGIPLDVAEQFSAICGFAIGVGIRCGKWDGIDAWGGRMRYRCVWKKAPEKIKETKWLCTWGLMFPGVLEEHKGVGSLCS